MIASSKTIAHVVHENYGRGGTQDIGWSFDVDTEAGTLAVRVFGNGGELLGTAPSPSNSQNRRARGKAGMTLCKSQSRCKNEIL